MNLTTQGFNVKTALLGSMLLAVIGVATPAFAEQQGAGEQGKICKHEGPVAGMHGRHEHHLTEALSLTEEQQQTLKTQRETQAETRKQLSEQIRMTEESLITAANSGASDNELQLLANNLGKLKATAALERARSHKAFLAVLTPEQQRKLEEIKAEHKGKMKGWHVKQREHRVEIDS